jgi:hypothetical protein
MSHGVRLCHLSSRSRLVALPEPIGITFDNSKNQGRNNVLRRILVGSVVSASVLLANVALADGLSHTKRPLVTLADGLSHTKRPLVTLADGLSHTKRPLVTLADGLSHTKRPLIVAA